MTNSLSNLKLKTAELTPAQVANLTAGRLGPFQILNLGQGQSGAIRGNVSPGEFHIRALKAEESFSVGRWLDGRKDQHQVKLLVGSFRPHAQLWESGRPVADDYHIGSRGWNEIENTPKSGQDGPKIGTDILAWLPPWELPEGRRQDFELGIIVTYFMANTAAQYAPITVLQRAKHPLYMSFGSEYIKGKNSWWVPSHVDVLEPTEEELQLLFPAGQKLIEFTDTFLKGDGSEAVEVASGPVR